MIRDLIWSAGVVIVALALGLIALGYLPSVVQAQASLKSFPAQGFTPESWVLTAEAPDRLLLCATPKGGGTLACRTAGEFRTWVRQRSAK